MTRHIPQRNILQSAASSPQGDAGGVRQRAQLSVQNHRTLGQVWKTIGQDPENEVIFTGSGEEFMMTADPHRVPAQGR
ncbi:MAG TPA: hypothetical protein VK025_04955 [Steroidobacter sp.]|nr:hypothetical protein [Steroidobacter sp.]